MRINVTRDCITSKVGKRKLWLLKNGKKISPISAKFLYASLSRFFFKKVRTVCQAFNAWRLETIALSQKLISSSATLSYGHLVLKGSRAPEGHTYITKTSFLKFKEYIKTCLRPKCRCKVCINMWAENVLLFIIYIYIYISFYIYL